MWTPDGRRLVTGAASGEFTLWNGMAFNFETILQAHDYPVRSMSWSRDGNWLATGDQGGNPGFIRYLNFIRIFHRLYKVLAAKYE